MNRNKERGSMYGPELTTGIETASSKLVNSRGYVYEHQKSIHELIMSLYSGDNSRYSIMTNKQFDELN